MSSSSSSSIQTEVDVLRLMKDCISTHASGVIMRKVMDSGVNPDGDVCGGLRPLHYAAYENHIDAIKVLLEYGAKVDVSDVTGYTPLHIAAKHGHCEAAAILIDHGAMVNFFKGDASKEGSVLVDFPNLDVNPLTLALEHDNPACVALLLSYGANPNQKYFMGHEINLVPLDHRLCIELLLEHGADPNTYGRGGLTVLHKACKCGDAEVVKILCKHDADLNIPCAPKLEQKTALHYAAMLGHVDAARALLEAGARTSKPETFRATALEYSITQDKVDVCKLLLSFGADPNEPNDDFSTPLQVACATPNLLHQREMIKDLLDAGADPNLSRETFSYLSPCLAPIVDYIGYNHVYDTETVRLLLRYGAEVNMRRPTKMYRIVVCRSCLSQEYDKWEWAYDAADGTQSMLCSCEVTYDETSHSIVDKSGILFQVRKLKRDMSTLDLLIEAAEMFDKAEIETDRSGMSGEQIGILTTEADCPRSLAHLCRLHIRRRLRLPIPPEIEKLPLPAYFKKFLLYDSIDHRPSAIASSEQLINNM